MIDVYVTDQIDILGGSGRPGPVTGRMNSGMNTNIKTTYVKPLSRGGCVKDSFNMVIQR